MPGREVWAVRGVSVGFGEAARQPVLFLSGHRLISLYIIVCFWSESPP